MRALDNPLATAPAQGMVGYDLARRRTITRPPSTTTWTLSPISRQGTE
jgi:hypothetical protein